MEITSRSVDQTKEVANKLAKVVAPKDVIALYGDLGSGKTTFTRLFADVLGAKDKVQSPTFVIMRKYRLIQPIRGIHSINHFDLYRLTSAEELEEIDLKEHFEEEGTVSVIEWPEIAETYLKDACTRIYFEYVDELTRKIHVDFKD